MLSPKTNFAEGNPTVTTTVSRRGLLKGVAASAGAVAAAPLAIKPAFGQVGPNRDRIVFIFMRYACDSLTLLAPVADPHYQAARPGIAVSPAVGLPVGQGLALHPRMSGIFDLFNNNQAAVVNAAGIPNLELRSHFEAQAEVERAAPNPNLVSGWLANYLNRLAPANPNAVFRAVSAGSQAATLRGTPSTSLAAASRLGFVYPDMTETVIRDIYNQGEGVIEQAGQGMYEMMDFTNSLFTTPYTPENGAVYPNNTLGSQLAAIARLAKSDVSPEVFVTEHGSWDTHLNMGAVGSGGTMDTLVGQFNDAITAFVKDLGAHMATTTIVCMTEFGRTFRENGSGGTDHGEGSAMWLFGNHVNAGVHGVEMNLAPDGLTRNAIPATTDYRDVLAEVCTTRLPLPPGDVSNVIPGHTPTPVGALTA